MTEAEIDTLLKDLGRQMSEAWLKKAVESADNDEQATNQLNALHAAAINLLAQQAYNLRIQTGLSYSDFLHELSCDIIAEMRVLDESADLEFISTNGDENE